MNAKQRLIELVKMELSNAEDNLCRARNSFRDCSSSEMQEKYGDSGCTRRAILNNYQHEYDELTKVLELVMDIL